MKKTITKIAVIVMATLMILSCAFVSNAANNGKITINVTVKSSGAKPDDSVNFTVYKIAYKTEQGLASTLETTLDVTDTSEANLINISKFCRDNGVLGTPISTDKASGTAVYEGLDDGIYLIVSNNAADSIYADITPTSVTIADNAQKSVNIELSEKYPQGKDTAQDTAKETTAETTAKANSETTTVKESETEFDLESVLESDTSLAKALAQTGMVQWPIPVFGGLGLAIVIIGIIALVSSKKKAKRNK